MTRAAAVAVAAAAWLGAWVAPPWPTAVAGLIVLVVLARAGRRSRHDRTTARLVGLLVATGLLAGGLAGGRVAQRDAGPLHGHVERSAQHLVARIVTEPQPLRDEAWAVVRVERVDGTRVRARALAWVPRDAPLGATLAVRARVDPLPLDGFGAHLRALGAGVALRTSGSPEAISAPAWPLRATTALRDRVRDAARAGLPADSAALLTGLTTGDARDRSDALEARLRAAGLSHLVVVSGRHTALFLAGVIAACSLLRASYRATRWTALAALSWFVVLVRWQPSVLRAAAVAAVVLAADLLGRERDVVRVLACAVLALLLVDPLLARRLGFALSVAATAGVLGGIRLADRLPLPRALAVAAAAALGAQAAVAPLLAFGGLDGAAAAAVPANLVAAPAAAVGQLLGALVAVVAVVDVHVASEIAGLAGPPLAVVLGAARLADVVVLPLVGGVVALTACAVAASRGDRRGRALLVAGACAALLVVVSLPRRGPVRWLTMTALDVGQGDAVLVEAPGDGGAARMLVDGGPGDVDVAGLLARRGIRSLAFAVVTHPHADHADGMAAVLDRLRVERLALGPVAAREREQGLADVLAAAVSRAVPVVELRAGQRLQLGAASVEVLWPPDGLVGPPNDRSLVLRVTGPTGRLLLTGDVEASGQRRLLRDPARLAAEVVKLPHHGAATNAPGFVEAVGAAVAVVSVGEGNDYGHPAPTTLAALTGAQIARTDLHGAVVVVLSPDGPVVVRSRSPPLSQRVGILAPRREGGARSCCTSTGLRAPTCSPTGSPGRSPSRTAPTSTRSRPKSSPCTPAASSGG